MRFVVWLDPRLRFFGPPEWYRTGIQHFGHCVPADDSARTSNNGVRACPHTGQFMVPSYTPPDSGYEFIIRRDVHIKK